MVLVEEPKQVVAPGEVLAEGDHLLGDNAYRIGTQIFSACVGILEVDGNRVFVVPLKGGYFPRVGDLVAGRIVDIGLSGWSVDIRAPYEAMLPASETPGPRGPRRRDLSTSYDVGDMVLAEVLAFDRTRDPLLTVKGPGLGKVATGRVVEISAAKIPRLIGRKGTADRRPPLGRAASHQTGSRIARQGRRVRLHRTGKKQDPRGSLRSERSASKTHSHA